MAATLPFADSDYKLDADHVAALAPYITVVTAKELEVGQHILLHNVVVTILSIYEVEDRVYVVAADTFLLVEFMVWSSDMKIDLLEE